MCLYHNIPRADGQWSRSGAGITGESYATAEAVVKGIPEIDALFNNPEAKFLVFMPSDRVRVLFSFSTDSYSDCMHQAISNVRFIWF
jgi:hypothetical protein